MEGHASFCKVAAPYCEPQTLSSRTRRTDARGSTSHPDSSPVAVVQDCGSLLFSAFAISVFHDENDGGKLDANALGIPRQGVGVSNNRFRSLGPGTFEDAKFAVRGDLVVDVSLQRLIWGTSLLSRSVCDSKQARRDADDSATQDELGGVQLEPKEQER
jgi:uncharacterized protein (DUF2141 family)